MPCIDYSRSIKNNGTTARANDTLQTEINQLNRQFWVTKAQVKANKYDLSASRYRQIEQDEPASILLEEIRAEQAKAEAEAKTATQAMGDTAEYHGTKAARHRTHPANDTRNRVGR